MRQDALSLATIGAALLLMTVLMAGQVSATATKVELSVSHQWIDANNAGAKNDLSVTAHVNVQCGSQGAEAGTVTASLVDPNKDSVRSALQGVNFQCGQNSVNLILNNALTVSGKYTLTTVVTLGSVTVTDVKVFDPNVAGSMGPLAS